MTEHVMKAAKALKGDHIHVEHIGLPTVYPLDRELILKSARKTKRVLIVEEHYQDGGLGTLVTELLSEEPDVSARRHGIPKCYATNGPYNDVLSYYERSEEHTSELQSRINLVCRLLLEKKKNKNLKFGTYFALATQIGRASCRERV